MKPAVQPRKPVQAQTLVIFAIGIGVMALLCGFAIDSGLLYLAKARLSRAVDGAALSAVGNFSEISPSTDPTGALNRDAVATIMRNFAIANYGDLSSISTTPTGGTPSGGTQSSYVTTSGANASQYTYIYADPSPTTGGADSNANPPYRRYVQVVLQTGAGGQITSGQCSARCPAHTYFMGVIPAFADLKVSSSAVATRNPRLIMVVVDRSASMLSQTPSLGGAFGLPAAITTFLNFFDTSSDYVGLVSFGSSARLEMPLTTNFLEAGTNDLYDSYQIDNDGYAIPGVDPEEYTNYNNFTTNDVRRMKFGGQTAADEGIRMAVEQLMQNPGYSNPNVVKYIVLFTDGAWNTVRTMVAAPGYTNVYTYPNTSKSSGSPVVISAAAAQAALPGVNYGANNSGIPGMLNAFAAMPMPFLSPWPDYSNAVTYGPSYNSPNGFDAADHQNDQWQSADGVNEPLGTPKTIVGTTMNVSPNTTNSAGKYNGFIENFGGTDYYASTINVWLPPGSVDYTYTNGMANPIKTVVSDYTNPSLTTNIDLTTNEWNVLVVPGYVTEGIISDSLDLPYPDNAASQPPGSTYPRYCNINYNIPFMWPDESNSESTVAGFDTFEYGAEVSGSAERALMFRNYANLLTGYYVLRPDDPPGTSVEPLTGVTRPLYGNGAYYPGAGFYWPFDLVGIDGGASFSLRDAISGQDPTDQGYDRFIGYSINMLSTNAEPEYAGELFYEGTGGTNSLSGTSAVSTQITSSSTWQSGVPNFVTADFSTLMTNETSHFPTNIGGAIWRPMAFNGSNADLVNQNYVANTNDANLTSEINLTNGGSASTTGGYVQDGTGRIFKNAMAYSGRPTHYFDFSKSSWEPIPDNHIGYLALGLGNWKALEYAWHARAAGVTIYTVGYGGDVSAGEQVLLAQVANATNSTGASTGMLYNAGQPIGQQFFATTPDQISNDFYLIGTAINGALTQ